MMQIKFSFNDFIFYGVCLPQLGSVPAAYAVVAGRWDWPIQNDVISLRFLRCVRCVGWKLRFSVQTKLGAVTRLSAGMLASFCDQTNDLLSRN